MTSLITPHWNRAALLRETAASVLDALGPGDEWLVVDDGSETVEWEAAQAITGDTRVRWLRRDREPKGPSTCRNIGLAAARGDRVMFLDSDDLLSPRCLRDRAAAAAAEPDVALHVFPVQIFRERPGDSDQPWNTMGGDHLTRFLRSDGPWCVSSGLWRREALAAIGGFNERVFYGDDEELHIRALVRGTGFREHPDAAPDVFVRRSEVPRVTSGMRPEVLASRLDRLSEVSRLLRSVKRVAERRLWAGQYFHEAEFHLFNQPEPWPGIRAVLARWRSDGAGTRLQRGLAGIYLRFAAAARQRAYLLLRMARRGVLLLLPSAWFTRRAVAG